MRVTVNLPEEDLAFLDAYAEARGLASRSWAIRRAIAVLRSSELGVAYERAWEEWTGSGVSEAWDVVAADGLRDARR